MSRTKNPKNTCPENAGAQNMTQENFDKNRVKSNIDELNGKLLNKINTMTRVRHPYSGTWTEEQFKKSVDDYFEWCEENDFEPSKPSIQLWLKCGRTQLWEWASNPKHGFKHEIMEEAFSRMESIYFHKMDNLPIPNMFKLKTNNFGYVEQKSLDITTNGNDITDKSEVKNLVDKLGLDK